MKYNNILIFCVCILILIGCKKDSEFQESQPIFIPEPFENNFTFFNLPEFDLQIIDTTSICSNPLDLERELDSGGPSGFHLRTGFSYNNISTDISLFKILLHVRGFDELPSSNVPFELITNICELNPEQCFVTILIKWQETFYSNIAYEAIPYEVTFLDSDALYDYTLIEVNEEERILECFDNNRIMPIEFVYDGYLFNDELSDSIRVENLMCNFTILTF